jgi:hypothetical protein
VKEKTIKISPLPWKLREYEDFLKLLMQIIAPSLLYVDILVVKALRQLRQFRK